MNPGHSLESPSGSPPREGSDPQGNFLQSPESRKVIELEDVVVRREKGGFSFTLYIPRLHVSSGEFVAIVGQSGCGKSTLLDLLGLILAPTQAKRFVFFDSTGMPISLHEHHVADSDLASLRRSQIGYVLQTGGLLPFLSVRRNIELPRRINGMGRNASTTRRLAEALGIESQLNKLPQHLSGGQRQRAAIARALAHQPPIVLADEPTAAVDRETALDILIHFKGLVRRLGTTLLMVTHDTELVRESADRFLAFRLHRPSETRVESTCYEVDRSHA